MPEEHPRSDSGEPTKSNAKTHKLGLPVDSNSKPPFGGFSLCVLAKLFFGICKLQGAEMTEAWAAIAAALIAALAATFGLVLTKENKISEFRQIWISELRTLLTGYSSLMSALNALGDGAEESYEQKIKDISRFTSEIKLRLNYGNPSEDEKLLLEKAFLLAGKIYDPQDKFLLAVKEFDAASFTVLKGEWERVKKGEYKYRICLHSCIFILSLSMVLTCIYVYFHFEHIVEILVK